MASIIISKVTTFVGPFDLDSMVSTLACTGVALVSFTAAIHQPPGIRRWICLPLVIFGPAYFFIFIMRRLPPHILVWIWVFTIIIWTCHATSILYIEQWSVPKPAVGWNWHASRKAWNNPRRIPISTAQASITSRARFVLQKGLLVLVLFIAWVAGLVSVVIWLSVRPRDFDPPSYIYFAFNRAALLRVLTVIQWVFGCYVMLTAIHALVAVIFVGVLCLDNPEEWPPLWGKLLEAYSIRRFWGRFWQRIGAPAQLSYGKAFSKAVGLRRGSSEEKILVSLCVFTLSGMTHVITNLVVYGGNEGAENLLYGDAMFLLLNFIGGLAELCVERLAEHLQPSSQRPGLESAQAAKVILRYGWVFAFLYCVVPPYQYPQLKEALGGVIPDVRFNVQLPPYNHSLK
jgi:hypothetical protein